MKLVTSVNESYLDLLDVWLWQSAPAFGMPVSVCCMDEAAWQHCELKGIPARRPPHTGSGKGRGGFWLRRFDMLEEELAAGDIVHSDVDAFWLRPPSPMFDEFPDDLVFSREFGVPRHVFRRWGFVLCCGFFKIRSTPGTRAFFVRWREATRRHMDDQRALNELLVELGAEWTPVGEGAQRCRIVVDGHAISALALASDQVAREPPYAVPDAVIAHPYFERQFFRSYVELMRGLFEESGSVVGPPGMAAAPGPPGAKPRDVATFHALRWLLDHRPGNGANWAHLGVLHLRLGEPVGATLAFGKAQELGAKDDWSLLLLGTGLAALGKRNEALAQLRILASRGNLEFELSHQAARALAGLGAWTDAARLAVRAGCSEGVSGGLAITRRVLRRALAGAG